MAVAYTDIHIYLTRIVNRINIQINIKRQRLCEYAMDKQEAAR